MYIYFYRVLNGNKYVHDITVLFYNVFWRLRCVSGALYTRIVVINKRTCESLMNGKESVEFALRLYRES